MKQKHVIALVVLIVILAGFWIVSKNSKSDTSAAIPMSGEIEREDLGMSFRYPATYELRQMEGGLEINGLLMQGAFTISSTTTNLPVTSGFVFTEAVEGLDETAVAAGLVPDTVEENEATSSPALSKEERLWAWAEGNNVLTSYDSRTADAMVTNIDGVEALFFTTKSDLLQDTYVVLYRNDMYLFVGQYETEDDVYQQNFKAFIDSIYFL